MKKNNAFGKIITFIFSLIIFAAAIFVPLYSYAASSEAKLSEKFKDELRKSEMSETVVQVEQEEVSNVVTDHNAKLPFVVKTVPADSDTNISINAQIIIMFNKPMDYLSINRSSITVMDEVGSVIEGNISYDSASYTATFSPRTMFSKNTLYSIFIPSYLIRDAEGNSLDKNVTISFRTESRSETTRIYENRKAPRAVKNSPEDNACDVPLDAYIMVDFSLPLAGSKINDSTITINDGSKNIDGKTVYIEKERQVLFVPGKNLEHGKVYRVTVSSINIESLEGFRLAENHSWTFSTKKPLDEVPPEVISTSPLDGAYEVSEQARISASFSEDVEPTTFNKYTVILSDGNQDVPGKITYDKRTQKVAFIPLEKLKSGQKYNMLISTGVKDLAGNAMNAPKEWTFTTKKPVVMEKPRIVKTYPVDNEKSVKIDSKIFVYFNKVMNEATCNVFNIKLTCGVRSLPISTSFVRNGSFITIIPLENLEYSTIYKVQLSSRITDLEQQLLGSDFQFSFTTMEKPDTTPPEIVTTMPQDGALNVALNSIISVRLSEPLIKSSISQDCLIVKNDKGVNINGSIQYEDAEKLLTFIPEARFEYLTKYIVSVKDTLKDRTGNRLKNSMTWSFTTPQAPDSTSPRVISWLPKTGEQMIAVGTIIQIIFSERVKEDSVNGKNIQLYDDSGTEVNAAVTYDTIMKRVTITPRRNLEFGMSYKVVVSKLISDLAGNCMKETFLSHFKTVPAPDRTRPELSSTKPESGAINVSLNSEISATFTKKLDPLTVTPKNV
ncbi:MAG TPA: Ig-like domain-containing protein, partial [Candidatus Wallbacteria bacterium]|nr:Ig-like domain-containing protein [Candidatus Wallbacteria bacterium]